MNRPMLKAQRLGIPLSFEQSAQCKTPDRDISDDEVSKLSLTPFRLSANVASQALNSGDGSVLESAQLSKSLTC